MEENVIDRKTVTKEKVKRPDNYVAVIKNDDFTSFDMVIFVLQEFFQKSFEEAEQIAATVHNTGKGIAGGPYQLDVCETKCSAAMSLTKAYEMPLQITPEKA